MLFSLFQEVMVQFLRMAKKTRLDTVTFFLVFFFSLKNSMKKSVFLTIIMHNKLKMCIIFFLMKINNNLLFCNFSEFNILIKNSGNSCIFFPRRDQNRWRGLFFFKNENRSLLHNTLFDLFLKMKDTLDETSFLLCNKVYVIKG